MRKLLLLFFFTLSLSAQEMRYVKGTVIDSLQVSGSAETYALYLPTSFDGRTESPVIFIYDGQGRGKAAAQLFQTAAEDQGYILVSSNDISPEKSLENNLTSGILLIQEVVKTLPVDMNSISVAGFAEGARVATSTPLIVDEVHGVIYVGDQFINLKVLEERRPFYSVGIVGNRQIELGPIEQMSEQLNRAGFPSEVYIYKGDKQWPRPELIFSAVGSLTLQAMRLKKRAVDESLVNHLYQEDLRQVNLFIAEGNVLLAFEHLLNMETKFEGLKNTEEIIGKIRQLERSSEYQEQLEKHEELKQKENRLWSDFVYYFEEDIATLNFENLGWWNYQKLQLDKLTQSEDPLEIALGYRLLDLLEKMTEMEASSLKAEDAPLEQKLLALILATVFDQQDFEAYKNIISLSATDGDFPTALFYLEEMLKNGYSDLEALYEIEGTLGLKLSEDYNKLIKKYLGTAKYYNYSPKQN